MADARFSAAVAPSEHLVRRRDDRRHLGLLLVLLCVLPIAGRSRAADSLVVFEAGQVRPVALSPDGSLLFAVNTPDSHLAVFDVTESGLARRASIPVGLEPVAVAARTDTEVWVVNHLSDSVSIVDVGSDPPRVVRTLLTCDEPRDIVFGGPLGNRAFVTTARRGQNCPIAPELSTPGLGRALVMVYDALNLGSGVEGTPLTTIELFGDTPRALAVTPDGSTVYAAVFYSGNQTTSINQMVVCNDPTDDFCTQQYSSFELPGGLPPPTDDADGVEGPKVGLIVRYDRDAGIWKDELGRDWSDAVRFDLPDQDVFSIDATATPPVATGDFRHVGTVLYNMAVNPVSGAVYVTNTEARNEVRFIGKDSPTTTIRGHQHESRVTVLDASGVHPRHLNKHIDYSSMQVADGVKERSLALPLGAVVSDDGATLYVAGFGSGRVAVFATSAIEDDSFVPTAEGHLEVGGGPSGLALGADGRLYVLERFDNFVAVVDTSSGEILERKRLHTREPANWIRGRRLLYDANLTSSNGEATCASCHVFGDFDALAWDMGDPQGSMAPNLNPTRLNPEDWHPLKGPMTTQSLRGMRHAGPLHWRGDRTGPDATPPADALDVEAAFKLFNGAFDPVMGREEGVIDDALMTDFAAFALELTYPPNPIRSLNDGFTPAEAAGRVLYNQQGLVPEPEEPEHRRCSGCHPIDEAMGHFGADGTTTNGVRQWFKTPHFRNLYQKVGMFGMLDVAIFLTDDFAHKGDQVRGFGFDHAGATDTLLRFNHYFLFAYSGTQQQIDQQRRDLTDYMFAFPSNLRPIVGQQVTLTSTGGAGVGERIDLLIARARASVASPEFPSGRACELVVKGVVAGEARGWLRNGAGLFESDRASEPPLSDPELRALAQTPGQALTYSCVPFGSGTRMGLDRDEDGVYDRDEIDAGTFPVPEPAPVLLHVAACLVLVGLGHTARRRGGSR